MGEKTFEEHVQEIEVAGYTVLPGLLTPAECEQAQAELERIFEQERELPGSAHGRHGGQAYNLMNKAPIFEKLYQLPPLLRLLRHFLGEDCVLSSIQAHRVDPGAPAQGLHYDGSITGPFKSNAAADAGRRLVSHVLGFNVVFCISDYTRTNGATRVVPGSHRYPGFDVPRDRLVEGETTVEAPRGSVLVFNIALWHGASANTGDTVRYAVMTPWRRSWLRPEADLPRIVLPEVLERAGEDGRTLFGFSSRAPYTDRWQWDWKRGRPKPEWEHLRKDDL